MLSKTAISGKYWTWLSKDLQCKRTCGKTAKEINLYVASEELCSWWKIVIGNVIIILSPIIATSSLAHVLRCSLPLNSHWRLKYQSFGFFFFFTVTIWGKTTPKIKKQKAHEHAV